VPTNFFGISEKFKKMKKTQFASDGGGEQRANTPTISPTVRMANTDADPFARSSSPAGSQRGAKRHFHDFDNVQQLEEDEVELGDASMLYSEDGKKISGGGASPVHYDDSKYQEDSFQRQQPRHHHATTPSTDDYEITHKIQNHHQHDGHVVNIGEEEVETVDTSGNFFTRTKEEEYQHQHGLYLHGGMTSSSSIDSIASFASSTDLDALAILNDDDIKGYVAEQLVPIGEKETIMNSIKQTHGHRQISITKGASSVQQGIPSHHHDMVQSYGQGVDNDPKKPDENIGLVSSVANSFRQKIVDSFRSAKSKIMQKDQPVLLPSQKRKLRGWFMKKYRRARRKEAALEEEEEEEEEPIEPIRPKSMRERLFGWCQADRSESRVLYTELSEEDKLKIQSLILDLGFALTLYGISANRTEYHLTLVCTYFGIDAYFNITPVGIWFSFGQKVREADNRTYYVKVETQMLNLDKLSKLDLVARDIARGRLGVDEARKEIQSIVKAPNVYDHPVINIFMHFICPGLFGLLWSGNVAELLTCLTSGLAIGIVQLIFQRFAFFRNVNQIIATVTAGMVGIIMKAIFWGKFEVSVSLIALCKFLV